MKKLLLAVISLVGLQSLNAVVIRGTQSECHAWARTVDKADACLVKNKKKGESQEPTWTDKMRCLPELFSGYFAFKNIKSKC